MLQASFVLISFLDLREKSAYFSQLTNYLMMMVKDVEKEVSGVKSEDMCFSARK
jgi:hypothetical protein